MELWPYLETQVLVSGWYPDEDFMALLQAMARLVPEPEGMDVWEWIGRFGAKTDMQDIHALLVKKGDVEETLQRFPRMWGLYHDSGDVHVDTRAGQARLDIRHPLIAYPEFCRLQTGHLAELITIAGAKAPRVRTVQRSPSRLAACWSLSWS